MASTGPKSFARSFMSTRLILLAIALLALPGVFSLSTRAKWRSRVPLRAEMTHAQVPESFSRHLRQFTSRVSLHTVRALHTDTNVRSSDIDCAICKYVVGLGDQAMASNGTVDVIEFIASVVCVAQKVEGGNWDVCRGGVAAFTPELIFILTRTTLSPQSICYTLTFCADPPAPFPSPPPPPVPSVLIDPPRLPPDTVSRATVVPLTLRPDAASLIAASSDVGTFLQISDVHLDQEYAVGSKTDCDKPVCCRASDGAGTAGPFGDENCDTSPQLFQSALDFIRYNLTMPDFVIWTGDDPPHDVWNQSRAKNLGSAEFVAQAVRAALPGVPVFPAVGNHESFPVDQFEGPPYDSWLYTALAEYWYDWLSPAAAKELSYGGYFSTLMAPKVRLISLNTQYCAGDNFWLMFNETDPGGQLAWLNATLAFARAQGERVFIIGHIPWGSGCHEPYPTKVHALTDPFTDIIIAQLFGHTHRDSFEVAYDVATKTVPNSALFICPSITPINGANPSFRVYRYNRTTFDLLDFDEYTLNFTQANLDGHAAWQHFYSFQDSYVTPLVGAPLTPLNAPVLDRVVTGFRQNRTGLFQSYYEHWSSGFQTTVCDDDCYKGFLCAATSATDALRSQCLSGL